MALVDARHGSRGRRSLAEGRGKQTHRRPDDESVADPQAQAGATAVGSLGAVALGLVPMIESAVAIGLAYGRSPPARGPPRGPIANLAHVSAGRSTRVPGDSSNGPGCSRTTARRFEGRPAGRYKWKVPAPNDIGSCNETQRYAGGGDAPLRAVVRACGYPATLAPLGPPRPRPRSLRHPPERRHRPMSRDPIVRIRPSRARASRSADETRSSPLTGPR